MVFRRLLSVAAVVWLSGLLLGGGWLLVGGPLMMHADAPAIVPDETLTAHGYSPASVDHVRIDETVEHSGVEKRVNISVYATSTRKMTPSGATSLTTVTLPAWRVGGLVTTNPLAYVPLSTVLQHGLPHMAGSIESVEKLDAQPATVDGVNTTVTTFRGTTEREFDVYLHVSRVTIGDTLVVVVGMDRGKTEEREQLLELMQHVDVPDESAG